MATPVRPDGAPPGLVHVHSGKVRDLYRTPDDRLVMIASDRMSAFDFVLDTPIPDKGRILTAMSVWWFEQLADVVPNHLGPDPMAALEHPLIPDAWRGRAVVCEPLAMIPVEAVARGYLTGSGLLDYRATGAVCGIELPTGLTDGDRLPEPIFTPADKADFGSHDENVSYAVVERAVGTSTAAELRELTLRIYRVAADLALTRGIVLADTKLEFGRADATEALILGDEVLTPDSSRFWPADEWEPGRAQRSFDKQYVRNWLLSPESGWDRASDAPPPPLPADVATATRERYVEAYERLTGLSFDDWPAA